MNDKYIKPSEHLAARLLVDEMIVMSLQDARVFSLNPTASALWGAADGVTPLREIVARAVVEQFEVDPELAYQDALEVIAGLAGAGILRVADQPIVEANP
ncbi:MAG: PqqD family protein [Candidatus Binatia bacterium]